MLWLGALFTAVCIAAQGDPAYFSDDGFRIADLRAPVPDQVPGGTTVDTVKAKILIDRQSALPIDVLPQPPQPAGRPADSLWLPPKRFNIPGSVWLPNVGFGQLSDALDHYFREALQRTTAGDKSRKILIYCLADCWMSWNAAKRAADYGYTSVYWYPDGTTGWESAGLPVEQSHPLSLSKP